MTEELKDPAEYDDFAAAIHHNERVTTRRYDSVGTVAFETVYETIIHWDEGGGKRSRRELARRIVDLFTAPPHRPAEPVQEPVALDVTVEGDAAKLLASMLEPVLDDEPTPIRLLVGKGHSGHGLYVAAAEYQEEGAVLLVNAAPPQRKPLSAADALRIATEAIGLLQSVGPVQGLVGLVRAVEAAHGIKEGT